MTTARIFSLRTVWYGIILLFTLLPLMIFLPWVGPKAYRLLQEKALLAESQFNENVRDHVEAEISRLITMLQNKTDPIAYALAGKEEGDALLRDLLHKALRRERAIFSLAVVDGRGEVIAGSERHGGEIGDFRHEHEAALQEDGLDARSAAVVIPMHGRTYIGPTSDNHGTASFHVAVPVGEGRPVAVLLADIDAKLFWRGVQEKLMRRDVTTYLVDMRGTLLNVPPGANHRKGDLLTHLAIVRTLLANRAWDSEREYTGLGGERVFGVYSPIDMLNWGVISEIPTRNITTPILRMLSSVAGVVVVLMMCLGGIGLWLVKRMMRRMDTLATAFQAIARGDYGQDLPSSPFIEVADLVSAVNRMSRELDQRESELRFSEQRLQAIIDNSTAVIYMKDISGRYLLVNRSFKELFSLSRSQVEGRSDHELLPASVADTLHANDLAVIHDACPREFEERIKVGDKSLTYLAVKFPLADEEGRVYAMCSIATDITQRMRDEAHLTYLAYHDVLTGLPNRALFLDRLEHALTRHEREGNCLAVLFLDLDRFKYINDTLGHEVGDELLRRLARRLQERLRRSDTIARFGGDEFAVLLEGLDSADEASHAAEQLLDAFTQSFDLRGHELFMTTSIGISVFPDDSDDAGSLLKNADTAMYRAKERGRNIYQYYSREMGNQTLERLHLETDLRHAIDKEQFFLEYQPQVELDSGRILGVEALLRWRHPEHGLVSPVKFIPILEEMGLIVAVGEWVLRQACRQGMDWHRSGHRRLRVAVNLSVRQFHDPLLHERVRQILRETGFPASALELEITESVLMQHDQVTMGNLRALQNMGVRLSVDDFGTGYSSLGYLKRFPISTLKIDRAFIRDLARDPEDAAIVSAIIAMAHSLRMEVIAEGVETGEQQAYLAAQGCDAVQGYLYSRPCSATDLLALLNEWTENGTEGLRHAGP